MSLLSLWSRLAVIAIGQKPHRMDVRDRLLKLKPLAEAERMTTRKLIVKPRSLAEWKRQNPDRRAS